MAKKKGVKPGSKRGPYNKKPKEKPAENFDTPEPEIKSEELNNIEAAADKLEEQINKEVMAEQTEFKTEENLKSSEPAAEAETSEIKTETVQEKEPEAIKQQEEPQTTAEAVFKEKSGEENFEDWMKEYEEATPEDIKKIETAAVEREDRIIKKKEEEDERVIRDAGAELFNGAMLIGLCDFIFPGALKMVYKYILKNEKAKHVKTTDVMLTDDQLESIQPASDAAARYVFQKVHPLLIFGLSMFVAYSVNFKIALDKIPDPEKKIDEKKEEDKK